MDDSRRRRRHFHILRARGLSCEHMYTYCMRGRGIGARWTAVDVDYRTRFPKKTASHAAQRVVADAKRTIQVTRSSALGRPLPC